MAIRLDGIPLHVQHILTDEKRAIVEHKVPGMEGSLLQDLGKKPTKIFLTGTLYGEKVKEDLEKIRERLKVGKTVPFEANITTGIDIREVLIEDMKVNEVAGEPDHYRYTMTLREHLVVTEELTEQEIKEIGDQIEMEALKEAEDFFQNVMQGFEIQEKLSGFIEQLQKMPDQIESPEFLEKYIGFE